jgi:predicted transposase YdaD
MPYVTSIEQMAEIRGEERQKEVIALNLLRQGLALEAISQATGLTLEQLQKLQTLQAENQ